MTVSIRASLMLSALAMAGLTAAFVDPPEAEENAKSATTAPGHWSYGGEEGPAHWGELAPQNKPCAVGMQQSPIDLASAMPAGIAAAQRHWTPVHGGMVVNNGHTLQVEVADGGGITLDGKDYVLKQFHFHHPSEHTIDGKQFPRSPLRPRGEGWRPRGDRRDVHGRFGQPQSRRHLGHRPGEGREGRRRVRYRSVEARACGQRLPL